MRISVIHSTTYRYDRPVFHEPHTFRLRPRHDAAQRLLNFALDISPAPAGKSECLDQDGNVVLEAWFESMLEEMTVRSSFEIETLRENPFDFMLPREMSGLPLSYRPPLRDAVMPYLVSGSESEEVRVMARSVADKADGSTMAFLTGLSRYLFEHFEHTLRDHGPPLEPAVTLRERAGTCRDLAILFCAACRIMGIPARFVSGYEREAAFQEPAQMHAWAEVYLAGGGWRGYDPAVGLAVGTSHVAVAAAADPRLAAPISGAYRGSADSHMDYQIALQVSG